MSNLKGELRAEAFFGDMVLSSVSRVRRAKTYTGNLTITGAEGEEVTAESAVALNMKNIRARTVETRTIAGPSTAIDVDCDRCSLTSVSGDIEFIGALRRNARYELTSSSGNIRLVPDGVVGFDLEAVSGAMPNPITRSSRPRRPPRQRAAAFFAGHTATAARFFRCARSRATSSSPSR